MAQGVRKLSGKPPTLGVGVVLTCAAGMVHRAVFMGFCFAFLHNCRAPLPADKVFYHGRIFWAWLGHHLES